MEIQCPSCKKTNTDVPECVRCGCELGILAAILKAAETEIAMGNECLRKGRSPEAVRHAIRSWRLKNSSDAAKLAFLANVAEKRFEEAVRWYHRIINIE